VNPLLNRGVVLKSARELLPATLLLGVAIMLAEAVLGYVLPTFAKQLVADLTAMPFIQNVFKALVGAEITAGAGPEMFTAVAWVHPVPLALVWAHAAMASTRVPAGEVDRGTVDVLLGLPVSRWGVYASDSLAWLSSGVLVIGAALAGNWIGCLWLPASARPDYARVGIVLVNLLAMYLAVGALGYLCSSLSNRRGWAMGVVFAIVVTSFLVNYLAQFWAPAQRVEFLSVLRYYKPLFVMRDGAWPLRDIGVLAGVAVALWVSGGLITARRDLVTT
jgi:ABC-type transport system involved in multi-copper enzyme maturation permease subunit